MTLYAWVTSKNYFDKGRAEGRVEGRAEVVNKLIRQGFDEDKINAALKAVEEEEANRER